MSLEADRFPPRVTGMPPCHRPDLGITYLEPILPSSELGGKDEAFVVRSMLAELNGSKTEGSRSKTNEGLITLVEGVLLWIRSLTLARVVRRSQEKTIPTPFFS